MVVDCDCFDCCVLDLLLCVLGGWVFVEFLFDVLCYYVIIVDEGEVLLVVCLNLICSVLCSIDL